MIPVDIVYLDVINGIVDHIEIGGRTRLIEDNILWRRIRLARGGKAVYLRKCHSVDHKDAIRILASHCQERVVRAEIQKLWVRCNRYTTSIKWIT